MKGFREFAKNFIPFRRTWSDHNFGAKLPDPVLQSPIHDPSEPLINT